MLPLKLHISQLRRFNRVTETGKFKQTALSFRIVCKRYTLDVVRYVYMYLLSKTSCILMRLSKTSSSFVENQYRTVTVGRKTRLFQSLLECLQRSTQKSKWLLHFSRFLINANVSLIAYYILKWPLKCQSIDILCEWKSDMIRLYFSTTNTLENPILTSGHQIP